MEIHPPEKPLHSMKDILLQLMTITIGILIALSLEGILQWTHHRSLVREAKENIAREIEHNRGEIANLAKHLPEKVKQQEVMLGAINDLLARKPFTLHELKADFVIADLSAASWRSAEATGALGYMPYEDVRKYASIYDLQAKLAAFQDRALEGVVNSLPAGDPDKLARAELLQWKQRVLATLGNMNGVGGFVKILDAQYKSAVAER